LTCQLSGRFVPSEKLHFAGVIGVVMQHTVVFS